MALAPRPWCWMSASHLHRGLAAASLARLPDVDDLAPDEKVLVGWSWLFITHLWVLHMPTTIAG